MAISIFEIFKIGIGPSSSHTVGPMKAAKMFADNLTDDNSIEKINNIQVHLYGSLGCTGKGHGSDKAVILGLEGSDPETVEVKDIEQRIANVSSTTEINVNQKKTIKFDPTKDIVFYRNKSLPHHANGMTIVAKDNEDEIVKQNTYYSVGGGFVLNEKDIENPIVEDSTDIPYPFTKAKELLEICEKNNMSISQIMMENEKCWRSESEIREKIINIWNVMQECVKNGCSNKGILPGGLKVKRRAYDLNQKMLKEKCKVKIDNLEWVNLYALAVNEENAAGGKVVTAPTNGAAGIVPAVLHYYWHWTDEPNEDGVVNFLLTAAAIAILFKINASISGAEVGCQGEVGSACSMAAGALCEVLGGTPQQVENAAEIGMEHNLGLTCDPIGGLVQIPCIERNAMASVKAINAASMALRGDGNHFVSLDKVIITMRNTGADMKTKYKETSRGGLAVNIIEC